MYKNYLLTVLSGIRDVEARFDFTFVWFSSSWLFSLTLFSLALTKRVTFLQVSQDHDFVILFREGERS
jgi:hypothetical protein